MADETVNLGDIIAEGMNKAAETLVLPPEEKIEKPLEEKKTVEKVKEELPEEDGKDELGLTKNDVTEARRLLAALRDPAKAPAVVKFLMEASGVQAPETKTEAKEVRKALTEELKEALGPELAYMADKMGPIFEKFLNEKITEVQDKNEQRFSEAAIERETVVANNAQAELADELFGTKELPDEYVKAVSALIDEYKPKQGQTTKSYLKDMFHLAAGRLGKPITKQQKSGETKKVEQNRTDASSRLASEGKSQPVPGREVSTKTEQSKPMSIDEAVRLGLEGTNAQFQAE